MNATSGNAAPENRPKVGVVVGGGGLKSLAAVALFEFLNEAKIDIDLLIGCSGGSIIAGLKGAGYSSAQMRDLITQVSNKELSKNIDYRSLASIARLPFGRFDKSCGVLKADPIRRIYGRIFKDLRLEDLQPKTIMQVTDCQTGEGHILTTGLVADAVYASGAMFPILPPICIEGRWFIDGGYSSNVPIMEAIKHNMDVIIAVVLQEQLRGSHQQVALLLDYVPHVVRQPAVGKRHIGAAVEQDDLRVFIQPPCPGGTGGAPGDTSDDQDPLAVMISRHITLRPS